MRFFKRRNSDPNLQIDSLSTLSDTEGNLTNHSRDSSTERVGEPAKTSKWLLFIAVKYLIFITVSIDLHGL